MNRSLKEIQDDLTIMEDANGKIDAAPNRYAKKHQQQRYDSALARIREDLEGELEMIEILLGTDDASELIEYIKIYLFSEKLETDLPVNDFVPKTYFELPEDQLIFRTANGFSKV